ncbi:hypothetical protein [Pseudomonas putida]|uniref:hypothetical protein n=1 Tax=Pseudomonas putida TaxID=303 RepID=UPI0002EF5F58|nr:hypothetical protein [Pseudomonas putida]ANC81012.1 hypothetical protein KKK_08285 [Pseudomonas putida B6-2]
MRYNTNNPAPSNDPRDLNDNAIGFDEGMVSLEETFTDRFGRQRYTWQAYHNLVIDAKAQIDPTVEAAQEAVNSTAAAAISQMEETAANLGDDLNNKHASTYAQLVAMPQTRDGVVGVVDADPDQSKNGWYYWNNNTKVWVYFQNQPVQTIQLTAAELAATSASPVSDLANVASWSGEATNGGTLVRRSNRPVGINVQAGSVGVVSYILAMLPTASVNPVSLVGTTIQVVVTGRYTGDFGAGIKFRTDRAFQVTRSGVATNVGRVVAESYDNGLYRRVVEYTVTAQDSQIGVLLSLASGPAALSDSRVVIDRVAYGIVSVAARLTPYNNANLERSKAFDEVNASAGLSWKWEPATTTTGFAVLSNGATSLPAGAIAPNIAGIQIPSGSAGGNSQFYNVLRPDADQVKALAGSTIRLTSVYTVTDQAINLVDFVLSAGMRAARGSATGTSEVTATLVDIRQEGTTLTKVVDYIVDATDTQWAVSLAVHGSSPIQASAVQLQFKSLTWSVLSGAGLKRAADVAFDARFSDSSKVAIDPLRITSGDVMKKTVVTGGADVNGAVLAYENGIIVGFDIPAGKSGAGVYNRIMIPFDSATLAEIVGKTIRMTLEAEVSATFQAEKQLRTDRGVYVEGVGNAGTLISESFTGTHYVRVVEYVVAANAVTFGPVVSYTGSSVSANANSFRIKGLRWFVKEVNTPGVSAQDVMLDKRLSELEDRQSDSNKNYSGALKVTGAIEDTVSTLGFTAAIQAYNLSRMGSPINTLQQSLAVDAPATEAVTDLPFTLIAAPSGGLAPGSRLPHQYSSARVVKRVSDGVVLTEGVDYAVKPNTCYIYGLLDIANVPCTISYTGHLHRYDLVSLNPSDSAIVLTKGTGRAIDPEEYKPLLPEGNIALNEIYVYPAGIDIMQTWRFRGLRDQLASQAYEDWLAYCRSVLPKTLAKLRTGQKIRLIGYGSSSVDMGLGNLSPLVPNENRDLATFFDRIPADTRAKYPTYDNTDPDFAWSTRSDHVKFGFMWKLIEAMRERWGADVEYRNWGVGGTNSSNSITNGVMNGAYPDRLNAMIADNGDLMVLAFANGLGASYWYSSHKTIIEAFKAQGGEVIVLTSPRLNVYGQASPGDTTWKKAYDDSIQVALDTGSAYVPTSLIEGPGVEGNSGISVRNMSNANLVNHGGPIQLVNTGHLMAMIIP